MKAIFYVLALLVTAGGAYFSHVALKKFEDEKALRLATIDQNKVVTDKANKKDADLQKELVALEDANKKKDDLEAAIESLKSKERTLISDTKKVDATLEEQKAKFAQLEEIRLKAMETLKEVDVPLEELPNKVIAIEEDKKARTKELTELQAVVEAAQKNVEANQAEIVRVTGRDVDRSARIRRNAMESVVTAVNEDWGFVVIGAGSNTGFTPQTKLLVKRDGRLIAEVQPSAIEPSQTIAEIDRESVAAGVRIQPGDRVILSSPAAN